MGLRLGSRDTFLQTESWDPYLNEQLPKLAPATWRFNQVGNIPIADDFYTRIKKIPGTTRYAAITKHGKVYSFEESPMGSDVQLLMDIGAFLSIEHESGLTGIAFHPDFNNNASEHFRELFLFYTYLFQDGALPIYDRLSKFRMSDDMSSIPVSSEIILIQQVDPDHNHNAGELFFDNDGYLYATLGDGGKWSDWFNNGQKLDKALFSGMIRIDPDMDESRSHPIRRFPTGDEIPEGFPGNINENYYIPNDNPWVDDSGRYLEEFYAIGLRNPFSAYYDEITEEIWVGDVGGQTREEIDIIIKGGNYQWPYFEGSVRNEPKDFPPIIFGEEQPPVYDYGRSVGGATMGGLVYHGDQYPELKEQYLFGDWETGNIWALNRDQENSATLLFRGLPRIIDFFVGSNGRIYVLNMFGNLYELEKNDHIEDAPARLSELGIFTDLSSLETAPGILPYEINSPLWSDGARKKRWMVLPKDSTINFNTEAPWSFPKGTVFIKHFEQPITSETTKNLETRLFIIDDENQGYGLTYRWNENDSDAVLIGIDETVSDTLMVQDVLGEQERVWNYPTRGQCMRCHNPTANFVLGVKTGQMNKEVMHEGEAWNQLDLWQASGLFDQNFDIDTLLKMYAIEDTDASLEDRVRSYLDANCSHCHDGRPGFTQFDARFTTALSDARIINADVFSSNSLEGNKIIAPGDENRSELLIRDESLADNQMPPIAREVLDTTYLNTLREWINDLSALSNHPLLVENIVTVFPNPITSESFVIQSRSEINSMTLIDLNGKVLPVNFTQEYSADRIRVFLRDETMEGVFLLIVDTPEGKETKRLIVSR